MSLFQRKILKYQIQDALLYWLVIPAAVTGSGKFLDAVCRLPSIPKMSALQGIAALLCAAGLLIIWRAMHDLVLYGKGTANPHRPPKALVRQGVYGMCRHPMFFGYDLAALGVVLLSGSVAMLLVSYPVFLYVQIRFLRNEEAYLARRFKQDFADYRERIPFLVPFIHNRRK